MPRVPRIYFYSQPQISFRLHINHQDFTVLTTFSCWHVAKFQNRVSLSKGKKYRHIRSWFAFCAYCECLLMLMLIPISSSEAYLGQHLLQGLRTSTCCEFWERENIFYFVSIELTTLTYSEPSIALQQFLLRQACLDLPNQLAVENRQLSIFENRRVCIPFIFE